MAYRNDTGLVSVTEAFSPYISFDHINQDVLQAAAERGTMVHELIAEHIDGGFPLVDESIRGYFDAAMAFLENVEEVGVYEERMISEVHQYTGQIDLVCRMRGDTRWTLPDWKTSALISKSWPLQISAYAHLVRASNHPFDIGRTMAVQLRKDGTFKINEYRNEAYHFNLFLNALATYRYFKPKTTSIDWEVI